MTHATALPIRCPLSITPLGDRALLVTLGTQIDEATHHQVRAAWLALEASHIASVIEVVPAYTTLAIHYDPLLAQQAGAKAGSIVAWLSQHVIAVLEQGALSAATDSENTARTIELPVCYDADCAPDLEHVAAHVGLSREEVIRLHSSAEYRVHLVGFAPGFAYLGGLPESLATPRLAVPRRAVPRGSVGIAGNQTGIYPLPTPGGWQLIGRTPLRLFTPEAVPPVLLRMGDEVRIRRVSLDEYKQLEDEP